MDIKVIIEQTGHKVFIINALNGGMEYQDLALKLKSKGCDISANELHEYHATLRNYNASQQVKPTQGRGGETDAPKTVLSKLNEIDHVSNVDALQGLKMLRSLFFRQLELCHKLQTELLTDDMVIMNNDLKNLALIKVMYYDAVKIGFDKFIEADQSLKIKTIKTTTKTTSNTFKMG